MLNLFGKWLNLFALVMIGARTVWWIALWQTIEGERDLLHQIAFFQLDFTIRISVFTKSWPPKKYNNVLVQCFSKETDNRLNGTPYSPFTTLHNFMSYEHHCTTFLNLLVLKFLFEMKKKIIISFCLHRCFISITFWLWIMVSLVLITVLKL